MAGATYGPLADIAWSAADEVGEPQPVARKSPNVLGRRLRASVRRGSAPDAVLEDVGFRAVRGAVSEPGSDAAQDWSAVADRERADVGGPRPMGWTPLQ